MPKANVTPNQALNTLANKLKQEQAEYLLRLANYFTVYGFDPEVEDFQRTAQLMDKHGKALADAVFNQSSPNLMNRVNESVEQYMERQQALEGLYAAGATVTHTDLELFNYAQSRVFRNTRAGAQAQHAQVA